MGGVTMELSDSPTTGAQEDVIQTELKAGALHLPEVLMHAITHIAPAAGLILFDLALSGLFFPGRGGFTFTPFFPNHALSSTGLFLGVVFAIFSFTGFESVAPLAEESRHPRRNLPRAIMLSIIIMGVFYILTAWGTVVGWGTNSVTSLISSSQNPVFVLGQRLWGGAWLLILFSLLNSVVAVSIACNNASTRVFFGIARSGVLPQTLVTVQ